jgi:hypothetical protein
MGPIEIVWGTIAVMFVGIAMARGYHRELGATSIMLVGLVFLSLLTDVLHLDELLRALLRSPPPEDMSAGNSVNLILMLTYQLIFLSITFAGYSGRVLAWEGTPLKGMARSGLNLVVGIINGWLVAGTLWYYMDLYEYPLSEEIVRLPLTPFAQEAVKYLPPAVLSFTSLIILLVVLLIVRVRQ